ncbi:MAG: protein-methionine-sulfoxide reductase catalytic subunit MsrP [Thiothrix sp.]|nr:protein-methionine-sulfoxide reductase catalytic subunit MsrP [Thiothrix sp.]HPQ94824.1 protein-methionine-sulfoxide reductase catalytic subunit MsrP [Thiolinea sp.]
MFIRKPQQLTENAVTDWALYQRRREFLRGMAGVILLGAGWPGRAAVATSPRPADDPPNSWEDITSYNNFYEFGTGKGDPARNARTLQTSPWDVVVDGECTRPGKYPLEDLLKGMAIEERIYRLRCVEGWSMVIPWQGFELGRLLKRFEPTSRAKYVRFETLLDPKQMPAQQGDVLDWPYVEGLRMDEAMHPLTLLATGLYDKTLPNQNGAPLRLVVPWKYGFKSLKSIARISFVTEEPETTWNRLSPEEYGFYSNVNPEVPHPRWSQARERRIGEFSKRKTLMFNGYADQVASLYAGMDLSLYF